MTDCGLDMDVAALDGSGGRTGCGLDAPLARTGRLAVTGHGRRGLSLLGKKPGGWMARSPQLWTGRLRRRRQEIPELEDVRKSEMINDKLFMFVKYYITRILTFRIVSDSILVKFLFYV